MEMDIFFYSEISTLSLQKKWAGKVKAPWRRGPGSVKWQRVRFESGQGKERVEVQSNGVQGWGKKTLVKARCLEVKQAFQIFQLDRGWV